MKRSRKRESIGAIPRMVRVSSLPSTARTEPVKPAACHVPGLPQFSSMNLARPALPPAAKIAPTTEPNDVPVT